MDLQVSFVEIEQSLMTRATDRGIAVSSSVGMKVKALF
jgi:hypothetical protein